MSHLMVILNGKKASNEEIRTAIYQQRDKGQLLDVRVTWEGGDILRFVDEAIERSIPRILVGGGDGSLNEAVNALMQYEYNKRPELAILPLGTANDFASSANIPQQPEQALRLALEGRSEACDLLNMAGRYCLNVISTGFGAEVTRETPVELKNFLGGGAYTLMGIAKAAGFQPYPVTLKGATFTFSGTILAGVLCNGSQAGGGQQLAPNAWINDGLMELTLIRHFEPSQLPQVISELSNFPRNGEFIKTFQCDWVEAKTAGRNIPANFDGESVNSETETIRIEVVKGAVRLVLPDPCPLIKPN